MKIRKYVAGALAIIMLVSLFGCGTRNNNDDIWKISQGDPNIIVAVVDTGVDTSVSLLQGKIVNNPSEIADNGKDDDENGYIDDTISWDFYNSDNSIYDERLYDYHGTYICTNIANLVPNVSILPVKFLNGTKGTVKDAVEAVKYAIAKGAKVVNCSWNFETYSKELFDVMRENKDVIFVCAAGNSNINLDENKLYPCSYNLDNVISVGAVDANGNIYDTSGYGNAVDIMAPGVDVEVTIPNDEITTANGTSIAASFVTATVALMLAVNPQASPAEIKATLVASATPAEALQGKCAANGYIDIKQAIMCCQQ
ncbi:MAG: S8 family serine peptidase [Clostridiales bacterium]|nr:S8 family serine peptidase [Candidatus Cacconaster stercorequi]